MWLYLTVHAFLTAHACREARNRDRSSSHTSGANYCRIFLVLVRPRCAWVGGGYEHGPTIICNIVGKVFELYATVVGMQTDDMRRDSEHALMPARQREVGNIKVTVS